MQGGPKAQKSGYLKVTLRVGRVAVLLGAGRSIKVSIDLSRNSLTHAGDIVKEGEVLAYIHGNGEDIILFRKELSNAFSIVDEKVEPLPDSRVPPFPS